jgi:hypothetical protein
VVQLNVEDGRGDQQQELPGAGHALGVVRGIEPNRSFHPLAVRRRLRRRSCRYNLSVQSLDDTPGCDGLGTSKHDVERLAALIVAELRVRVAIDDLQCPLGILELHLCGFLLLGVHLLLALQLAGRRAILALLLHPFMELFCELLDLLALQRGMARGVVHRALRAAVVTIGQLTGAFVTSRPATAPTRRCRCGSGHSSQQMGATSLLLLIAIVATLGLGPDVGPALPLCRLGGWGVPGAALHSLGALVRQAEGHRNILDIVGGELPQHLLIPYSLA